MLKFVAKDGQSCYYIFRLGLGVCLSTFVLIKLSLISVTRGAPQRTNEGRGQLIFLTLNEIKGRANKSGCISLAFKGGVGCCCLVGCFRDPLLQFFSLCFFLSGWWPRPRPPFFPPICVDTLTHSLLSR